MEVNQVETEKAILMEKWYSFSLAAAKVIYARDQDLTDTMILRNLKREKI